MEGAIYPGVPNKRHNKSAMWILFVAGWAGSLYLMAFSLWMLFSIAKVIPNYLPNVHLLSISLIYLSSSYLFALVIIAGITLLKGIYRICNQLGKGLWRFISPQRNLPNSGEPQSEGLLELLFGIKDVSGRLQSYEKAPIRTAMLWIGLFLPLSFFANIIGTFVVISEVNVLGMAQENVPIQVSPDWLSNLGIPGFLFSVILETEFVSQYPEIFLLLLVFPGILSIPMLLNMQYILEKYHYRIFTFYTDEIDSIDGERREVLMAIAVLIGYIILYFVSNFFRPP